MIVERRTQDGAAVRLLARPVRRDGDEEIVVVGEPLAQRERALARCTRCWRSAGRSRC